MRETLAVNSNKATRKGSTLMRHMARVLATLAMALATTYAIPASAAPITLDFSQTAGFLASSGTEGNLGGGAAVIGHGGLEFYLAVTAPPGAPLGDSSAPPDIWQSIAWGCNDLFTPALCANGGAIGTLRDASDPFAASEKNSHLSALRVEGQFGSLTTDTTGGFHNDGWVDITLLTHQNHVVFGNVLTTVAINSFLRLGAGGTISDSPAPSVVNLVFTETPNDGSCTDLPAPGAPVNPLGSNCDDFFVVNNLDLDSVFLPAGSPFGNAVDLLIDFRLDPRLGALVCNGGANQDALCGSYAGPAIVVYTNESDTHALAIQAHLRAELPSLSLTKNPKDATFSVGNQLSFTLVVTNNGAGNAHIVQLNDPLPTTGGLTWDVTSITPPASGTCSIDASQVLSCTFIDVQPTESRTVVVTTNNVGGAPAASCTGNKLNNLATASTAGIPDVTDTGDYTCTPATNLKTVTQGGWGAPPNGDNPGAFLVKNFSGPVVIGGGGCAGAKTLTFTSAAAIQAFLPQGGPPKALTASATDPTAKLTVFAGQVLALKLNVDFFSPLGSFVLPSGDAAGKTVAQVLADANKALGGCGLPAYVTSISKLNDVVTSINEMFD